MLTKELPAFLAPWVQSFVQEHPAVIGAYLAGSTAELAPEAPLEGCSDIDIMLVVDRDCGKKPGKQPFSGMVIEGTYVLWSAICDPEQALGDYHVAHGLHLGRILFDKDGRLSTLCSIVAQEFAKPERIRQRIGGVFARIEGNLNGFDASLPPERSIMGLVFSAGILCHAVLVTAQKNPTVRMRYRATKQLDREDMQEFLLEVAGFGSITPAEASAMLDGLAELFDIVSPACKTEFPFTGDLLPDMKKSTTDDLRELISQGLQREAMFWIVATWTRLLSQAHADLPEVYVHFLPAFMCMAERIGLNSLQAQRERIIAIRQAMPIVNAFCEELISQAPTQAF